MRKYLLIGAGVLVLGLAIVFGPTALGLYRLQDHIDTDAKADQADAGSWPRQTDSCAFCHGKQGHSVNPRYPDLAGLPAPYVEAQLRAFASGQRRNPNMEPLAMQLADKDIVALGAYYAKQRPQTNPYVKPNGAVVSQGKQLVESGGCVACHGPKLEGQATFPRLAGQGDDYLAKQLDAFAAGTRTEPSGTMKMLTSARTAAERKAIASYLASLDPAVK